MRHDIEERLDLPLAWSTIFAFHYAIPAQLQWCYKWLRRQGVSSVIRPVPQKDAEVYFPQYTSWIHTPESSEALSANGAGITWSAALAAVIGEAAERFSLSVIPATLSNEGSEKSQKRAVDLATFSGPSDAQRNQQGWERWRFDLNSEFRWAQSIAVLTGDTRWIPAQLVYKPYPYAPEEPIIRLPSTSGAATGSSRANAMKHAIAEIIEREAFMITYLNRLAPPHIDLRDSTPLLEKLSDQFAVSPLSLDVYLLPTDAPLYVALAVISAPEHRAPAITIGAKACWDPERAVAGAIIEANHTRIALRNELDSQVFDALIPNDTIRYPKDHARYWARPSMRSGLDFLKNGSPVNFGALPKYYEDDETWLQEFFAFAKARNFDIFWTDLTPEPFRDHHLYIGKAIIPQLHPMHIDERFRYLGGSRLFALPITLGYRAVPTRSEDLNTIPHPFP